MNDQDCKQDTCAKDTKRGLPTPGSLDGNADLRQVLEDLPQMVYELDTNGNIVYGNKETLRVFGFNSEDLNGSLSLTQAIHPDSLPAIYQNYKKIMEGKGTLGNEYLGMRKDGSTFPIKMYSQPVIQDGKTIGVRGVIVDITEMRQAELELRRSQERHRLVATGANDGIWDWDLESNEVYYSPRYKEILGYTDEEFPNNAESWKTHIHPEDEAHAIAANLECIEGKVNQFEVEYRMRHKDGSWRWILGRGASAFNDEGKVYRLAGTHTDITVRKMQERTTNALYAISKAIGTSVDLNDLYSSIHATLGEVLDATNFFIALYDPETDSAFLTYWQDEVDSYGLIRNVSSPDTIGPTAHIIRTGEPVFVTDLRQWDKYGVIGIPAASWIGVPLKLKGDIIGTMTVQHYKDPARYTDNDVALMQAASEQVALGIGRKRSEEELTRMNEELESKVETRTAELKRRTVELETANQRLTELDAIKSALVSSISHELRTPLTSIRGFAKLAGKDFQRYFQPLAETNDLAQKGYRISSNLEIIESEGERLTRLINDFLDINRIESGKANWNDVEFNPGDVAGAAASALSGAFAEKDDVKLIIDIPDSTTPIIADPDKIQQAIINLLGNAYKFTQSGSVTLALSDGIDFITISVADTGIGISEDEQDEIFEKFHKSQGDTIVNEDRGTGLGLAICKEIIQHYGGTIWVESELGKGSTFSFSLPTKQG